MLSLNSAPYIYKVLYLHGYLPYPPDEFRLVVTVVLDNNRHKLDWWTSSNKKSKQCYPYTIKNRITVMERLLKTPLKHSLLMSKKKVDNIHTGVRTRVSRVKGGDPKPLDYEDSL
jgi:hypothetical protein